MNRLLWPSESLCKTFMKHLQHISARRISSTSPTVPFQYSCKCHKRIDYRLPFSIHHFSTEKKNDEKKPFIRDLKDLSSLSERDLSLLGIAVKEGEAQNLETNASIDSIPGTSKGGSRKLAIIFTCSVCETRSAKKFTERAYNHGVVLVRCPKCEKLHLIADNLGYFTDDKDGWNIEKLKDMSERENVTVHGDDDVLELAFDENFDGSTTDNDNNNKAK